MLKLKKSGHRVHGSDKHRDQAHKLGDPAASDTFYNCLTCKRFPVCKDPAKSFKYRCTRWKELELLDGDSKYESSVDAIRNADPKEHYQAAARLEDVISRLSERQQESNLSKLLDDALRTGYDVPPDLRIDDRDIPAPANYFEWVRNPSMSGMRADGAQGDLFPIQHKILVEYRGEYCPRCSDLKFLEGMHVNTRMDEFEDRVVLLKFGKCPKCKAKKSEFVVNGEMNEYYTLNGVAGQRGGKCIAGDSVVLTDKGPRRIGDLAAGLPLGYTRQKVGMTQFDGSVRSTSHLYVEERQRLHTVTLDSGTQLTGTACHPIKTLRGWVKLSHLRVSEAVPVWVGQNAWSDTVPTLKAASREATENFTSFASKTRNNHFVKTPATYYQGSLTPAIARLLGYYTAEGRGDRFTITCHDQVILDELEETFYTLFGFKPRRSTVDITDSTRHTGEFMNVLFDGLFFGGHSALKRIPNLIMQAPRDLVSEYLRALFEGDGGVEGQRTVTYTSISKRLIHELSALLNNLGVIHSLSAGWTWATNGSVNQVRKRKYVLVIDGLTAIEQFAEHIGFTSKRKNASLQEAIAKQRSRQIQMPFWYDKYPAELKQQFLDLARDTWIELRKIPNPDVPGKWLGAQSVFNQNHAFKRIYASNVALSRGRIMMFVDGLRSYRKYLSPAINEQIESWATIACNSQLYYTTVAGVKKGTRKRRSYDVSVPKTHQFMANGLANHNTAVINVNEGCNTACWIKTPNPQEIYGTLKQQILVATYCALTFNQVRANLWDPFIQSITDSPWFKSYHGLLDFYGEKYGEELYQFKDVFIKYRHRGLSLLPSGPNKRTMRGATRYSAVVDELGWFPFGNDNQDNTKMSAEEIHTALENSMATIQASHEALLRKGRSNLPKPLMSNISSPSEINDMIMQLHRKSIGSTSSYTFKYTTWDMNPGLPKNCSFIKRKFEQNEVAAMRDFGAEPPMSSASWITEIKNALGVFCGNKNNIKVRQHRIRSRSGAKQTSATLSVRQQANGGRILAIDAGYNSNSFAFALGRLNNGMPVIEGLGEVIPSRKAPISYPDLYRAVLLPLVQQCGVQFVVGDRWQHLMLMQSLEQETGVRWLELRAKYPDFENFRERVYDQDLVLPRLELKEDQILTSHEGYPSNFVGNPAAHLLYQMFTVRDYPGKTVEKGADVTDDLFRTIVLFLKAANDQEITGQLVDDVNRRAAILWGVGASRSSTPTRITARKVVTSQIGTLGARAGFGGSGAGAPMKNTAGVSGKRS